MKYNFLTLPTILSLFVSLPLISNDDIDLSAAPHVTKGAHSPLGSPVDHALFSDLAAQPIYANVCLIKIYSGEKLIGTGTGTLCTTKEHKFILSAHHILEGARNTATFNDGMEREILSPTPLSKALEAETTPEEEKNIQFNNPGEDVAIGFLANYPQNVTPALLKTTEPAKDSKDGWGMRLLKMLNYHTNIQEKPCHLAGYGQVIVQGSLGNLLLVLTPISL